MEKGQTGHRMTCGVGGGGNVNRGVTGRVTPGARQIEKYAADWRVMCPPKSERNSAK
jgi:hypothetical protein